MSNSSFADLTGSKAVITGASSGIGRAIAKELAAGGADVVLGCHNSVDAGQKLVDELREEGRSAELLVADLRNADEFAKITETLWNESGGVDIWINNAGVDLLTGAGAQLDYETKLRELFEIDIRSSILLSRQIGQRMVTAGRGVIVNIGWDQADRGMEGDSGELFAAAKNAIMGFTRSLAVSLAPQVRVNCIAPGWIRTAWGEQAGDTWQERVRRETPLERWGTPEDIAKLTRFLVSDEAAYITGQVINANGGAIR